MKFRKKPVVIEAEQWWPDKEINGVRIIYDVDSNKNIKQYGAIDTLEGVMRVSSGDWVITGVNGEKYPCKPDIFEKTYEKFEDTNHPIASM